MSSSSAITRKIIHGQSWSSWGVWWFIRLFKFTIAVKQVDGPKGPQTLVFPPPNLGRCTAERWSYSDWTMVTILPPRKNAEARPRRIMAYLYGSGFQRSLHPRQWGFAAHLAEALDAEVSVLPYPLAPRNNGHEVMPILLDVYRVFLKRADGREVIIASDSAGAHLALSLMYASLAHDPPVPLPHQLILISPHLNVRITNPEAYAIAPNDPALRVDNMIHVGRLWANANGSETEDVSDVDASNPIINPIAGDVGLLAATPLRITLVSAGYDILHADTNVWLARAEKAGMRLHYIEGTQQIHDFPTGRRFIWEGRLATDMIVEHVKRNSSELGF